jgi:hypothetical protein
MTPIREISEVFFDPCTDPHDVTGLLKSFFRELPQRFLKYVSISHHYSHFNCSLFVFSLTRTELHDALIATCEEEDSLENKIVKMRELFQSNLGIPSDFLRALFFTNSSGSYELATFISLCQMLHTIQEHHEVVCGFVFTLSFCSFSFSRI